MRCRGRPPSPCRAVPSMRWARDGEAGVRSIPSHTGAAHAWRITSHDTAISAAVVLHSFPLLSRSGHLKILIYLYCQIQLNLPQQEIREYTINSAEITCFFVVVVRVLKNETANFKKENSRAKLTRAAGAHGPNNRSVSDWIGTTATIANL